MPAEFSISVLAGELPLDGATPLVAIGLPDVYFALQKVYAGDSTIQALATEDADFDLSHVQPTRVLGSVVKAHAAQQFAGRLAAQHIVEALPEVRVQVVQHEVNAARGCVGVGQQSLHECHEVGLAPVIGDRDGALDGVNQDGRRIDSSDLLPVLTCCLT
jgi:hypothetical protein